MAGDLIVGYDGSECARAALAKAAELARLSGAGLVIAFAYEPPAVSAEMADHRRALEEMGEMQGETDSMLSAWRSGNAQKLDALLSEEYKVAPALYRMLVADRKQRWMPQLERLLKSDKDYLVVVGALHLVGSGGLLELTKARGYSPKQMP